MVRHLAVLALGCALVGCGASSEGTEGPTLTAAELNKKRAEIVKDDGAGGPAPGGGASGPGAKPR